MTKMSTTAETWFTTEPENQAYLISERLNATFWQARAVDVYWKVIRTEPPYLAHGYRGKRLSRWSGRPVSGSPCARQQRRCRAPR